MFFRHRRFHLCVWIPSGVILLYKAERILFVRALLRTLHTSCTPPARLVNQKALSSPIAPFRVCYSVGSMLTLMLQKRSYIWRRLPLMLRLLRSGEHYCMELVVFFSQSAFRLLRALALLCVNRGSRHPGLPR